MRLSRVVVSGLTQYVVESAKYLPSDFHSGRSFGRPGFVNLLLPQS